MNYILGKKGLEIKLSFKERLFLFLKGVIKLDAYSSYKHSAVLLKLINEATKKYGDGTKHGVIKERKTNEWYNKNTCRSKRNY